MIRGDCRRHSLGRCCWNRRAGREKGEVYHRGAFNHLPIRRLPSNPPANSSLFHFSIHVESGSIIGRKANHCTAVPGRFPIRHPPGIIFKSQPARNHFKMPSDLETRV